jgi:hypothetical protein
MSQVVSNNLSVESSVNVVAGGNRKAVQFNKLELNVSLSDSYDTMSSDSSSVGFDSSSEGMVSSPGGSRYSSSCDDEFESDRSDPRLDTDHGNLSFFILKFLGNDYFKTITIIFLLLKKSD